MRTTKLSPDLPSAVRESLVRTACSSAKVRAKREQLDVFVWYSMHAEPGIGDPGECAWARTEAEGAPKVGVLDDEDDETAFILGWFDSVTEWHPCHYVWAWYRDMTGTVRTGDFVMCEDCGKRCVEAQLVKLKARVGRGDNGYPDLECDSCKRPMFFPGL